MGTTAKGVPYQDLGDPPDGPAGERAVAQWVDDNPGIRSRTYAQINALTGADLWVGRTVHQSNTGVHRTASGIYVYNGVDWRPPWNLPWGELDYAEKTAVQSINTSVDDINGLTVSKSVVANRIILVRASFGFVGQNTSPGLVKVSITDAANAGIGLVVNEDLAAGERTTGEREFRLTGLSGPVTFKARAVTSAATMTINSGDSGPAWIRLADGGPNGDPA